MAPRCRSTSKTAPIVCFILTAVFLSITFAKPFQSEEFTLSQSDAHYYTTSPDYEYVKPVRLGTRHQRSVEETSVQSTSEFSVEGFDQVFHIQLSESMDLFNAGLMVKRIDVNGQVRIDQPTTGCFHQGYLKNREDATSVSLSTCNGLVGMIRTPEADFALKPLKENHILKMKSSEDEAPTHIMYKVSPSDMAISQVNSENERRRASDAERRETSGTKYVETSVVADSTMFDYHGDDTEFYLFTILNQVAGLFRDNSLSADLRLLITSITILESPQSNLDLTDELSHSLKNFCKWQKDEKSDISVLLTRRDLEIGGNDAVTGKAKDVGGACDPSRRCIIAEDHGPSGTIFTLAHEVGHSLGMYHDDAESGCANNRNIMATDNSGGSEAFKWSLCSNQDLQQFLSTSDSACLDKTEDDFPAYSSETVMMPGHFYDAVKQCQMTFGLEATVAEDYIYSQDMCLELQCIVPGRSEPVTNHIPALDGTKCGAGRGMICVHGQCLKVVSMYDCEGGECVPEWLAGSLGDCQPDCYAYRNVFCVERRDDSTTVLVPDESRCPEDRPAVREYCCETQPVVGETSYQVLNSECSVTCGTGSEMREIACVDSEGTTVNDTFCTDERPPEVVECAPAACPGITYVLFYDNYGECSVTCGTGVQSRNAFCATSGGTSESVEICRLVFPSVVTERTCNRETCPGTVVDTFFYQTTPAGSCSVTCGEGIQQLAVTCQNLAGMIVDDSNCASLQRPASSQICIQEDCTDTYRYVATSFGSCSVTCGTGERTRTIFCLNEANRVVDDAFCAALTRPSSTESCTLSPCTTTYSYVAQPFPECTLPCGTQVFTRTVTCVSSEGNVVSSSNCVAAGLEAPATVFDCGLDPCGNYVYTVGEYGECSATCGIGIQQRSVACIDLDNNNETVSNDLCSGTPPTSAILCNLRECPTEYSYLTSSFSDCSCAGIQTRFIVCITFVNGAPVRATDQDCINAGLEQPADTQACEAPISCNPVWRFGDWSDCSVTCGNGVQTRIVFCVESEESTVIVPSSSCDPELEPPSVQICNMGDCITYTWVSENFGDCSVTCGEGVRVRNVLCYAISGGSFEPVDGSLCNPELEPPSEEICDLEDCGGVYEAMPWSECSVTCALGVQTREVSCVTRKGSGIVISESECFNMTRPSESRECYLDPCPLPYGCDQSYVTEGSISYTLQSPGYPVGYPADLDCSKILVAPEGSIIQITFTDLQLEDGCAYDAVRLIDSETNSIRSLCDEVELPYVYESTGPMLEVLFVTDATVSRRGFSATYQAVQGTVLEYVTGEWGECSVTCGEGVEQRDLMCLQNGEEVDTEECVGLPAPPTTRPCTEEDCPLPGACGENILRLAPGSITSPEYPSVYPENVTCVNTIRAPPGYVIFIDFSFIFFVNQGVSCQDGDSLVIQDTSASTPGPFICQDIPTSLEITSLTNEVSLTFVSDNSTAAPGTGFSLTFDFVSPDVDICGGEITTSGQPIYSPNYPANYNENVTCVTNITNNEGCISIEFLFMDIDNGDRVDDICRDDVLTLTDYNNPTLSQMYCRQSAPESRWLSASGNVQVSFTSNHVNSSQGYIAIPRFVECPQAFWIPLPFGNCSAICGLGNRTRELECRNALTNELTDPENCPDEEPPRTELCFLEECPSCDTSITEGNRVIQFPLMDDYYLYNDECTLTITNENGCMNLFFISLDIDGGMGERCDDDYLMIFDPANMFAHEPYCGNSVGSLTYQSLGSTVELTLRTDDAMRFKSVEVFPSFGACPTSAFRPGPWSECSASCEGGVRTRVVPCVNLLTGQQESDDLCEDSAAYETMEECNTEECPVCSQRIMSPGVIVSPGFDTEDGYDSDLDCMYNISNPNSEECVTISFVSFDLGEPSENCTDYVQITDSEGDVSALYCGLPENATVPVFYSRSSLVEVIFRTDEAGSNDGFEAIVNFGSCPEFGFFTGNFSECSVTCGEGVQYRTVECRRFSNGQVVSDEICRDQRPADSRPCSLSECPSCDRVLTEEGIFTSPNSPMNYEDNQECVYTLISGEDECVRVSFIGTFEVGEAMEECEDGDYIELSDENWEYLDTTYCGNIRPPVWRSRTNTSSLTFYSDEEETYRGFTAYLAFVSCPQYGFTVGEYGECDVSCGMGIQMREVECTDLTTEESVSQSLCTDPRPPSVRECNSGPCPSCGETYTSTASIQRDDFMENEECLYNVTSLEGQCIRTYLLSYDLSPPPNRDFECEGDSLKFVDAEYPYRYANVCGRGRSFQQFITYGSTGLIYFMTDDEDQGGNFQIFTQFEECPEYGFTATEFSECSVTCGTGIRTRDVFCTRLETGENVGLGNCTVGEPLQAIEECNTQPCFDCNMYFNQSATIVSPGYPGAYPENLKCVYDFYNPIINSCWSIVANDFSVESDDNGTCIDGFYVEDLAFEGREPFLVCGQTFAPIPLLSFSDTIRITFYTNENNGSTGITAFGQRGEGRFNVSVTSVTCPQYGYLSGPYGECSVTCGEGVTYRNVTCRDLSTREAVNDSFCFDSRPSDQRPCRQEACPSCDVFIYEDAQYIFSPNYPDNYENDQSCFTTILAPEGMCINLFIISLELEEPNIYAGCYGSDFLQFIDAILEEPPYYDVDQVYCGNQENILWFSSHNVAVLNFNSNEEDTYPGYQIYSTFVDCQQYFYGVRPFGECSVTCGLGERRREIGCVDRNNNYTLVSDTFCAGDVRPIDTIPCYIEECPEVCYRYINETGLVTSPNYPDNYENNLDCIYELYNPDEAGCWQIDFIDFDVEILRSFCFDEFRIVNLEYDVEDIVLCGSSLPPQYTSISNNIEVQFNTDSTVVERGFNATFSTVECVTEYIFFPDPWGECSVTCGDGIQTREVNCVYLANGTTVADSFCNSSQPVPPTARPCEGSPPCPPCVNYVNQSGIITSPNFPSPYNANESCITYITPPEEECVGLFIISLQLPEPDENLGCYGVDNLQIVDVMPPFAPIFGLDQVFCGTQQNIFWKSATSGASIFTVFTSYSEDTYPGYQIFVSFADCDRYYFTPYPFGQCSETCGYGVRTRQLACVDSFNTTLVSEELCSNAIRPVETIPCFAGDCPSCDQYVSGDNQTISSGSGYPMDQECEYEINNVEGGCNRLEISVDLPPPNPDGECDRDYVMYSEDGDYEREIVLCGYIVFNITSRSSVTELTFVSDGVDDLGYSGFSIVNSFVDCPAYGFIADEEYGECDVTCGGGIQMRNVSCINLSNGTVVEDSLCDDARPSEFRVCGDELCPTCSEYINTTNYFIIEDSYEPNQDCLYTIEFEDSCVAVSFLTFELQSQQSGQCVDYLEIRDLAPFTDRLERTFCGDGPQFGYQWRSRSSQVQIRFVSDDSDQEEGFNLFVQAVPCPEQGFIYSNYSECSATCGEGVQTRNVTCVELDNGVPGSAVSDDECEDPRPVSSTECELVPCPSCDRNFTLTSPTNSLVVGSDMPYSPLTSCTNTLITDEGMCIRVAFASIDIEESEGCVNDSLVIADPGNEAIYFTLCQRGGIILPIFSLTNMLTLTLTSNDAVEGSGYNSIASRIDCPSVAWVTENIGSCSVTCGTGVQMRNVYCMNQDNGRRFAQEESCTEERPAESVPCVLDDCPKACDNFFTGESTTELTSPGFPDTPYENNLTCANAHIPFSSCLAVVVVEIDLGPPENCINDYLEIFDSTVDTNETRLRLCGNELPENNLWVGRTRPFYTRLTTNDEGRYKGYNLSLSYVPCPMQGFTVGEFGECSMVCGSGVRSRNVTCEDSNGNMLDDSACWGQRPLSDEPCGMNCTYNVEESQWSECSATCGEDAVQTRTVRCLSQNSTEVNTTLCENEGLEIPETERSCNLTACPTYQYVTSNYSQCSATCGEDAVQTRTVRCLSQNSTEVNTTLCENEGLEIPETERSCNLTACPTYQYVTSNYSQCSVTCGDGVQTRTVSCEDNLGNTVNNTLCANLAMPNTTQACSEAACPTEGCNYTISGTDVLAGNLTSPNYPNASPSGLSCSIDFIIPNGFLLNIRFVEFNLDSSCSENVTLNGDVAGETFLCSSAISLPASTTFTSDSTVSLLYQTDDDESNTPYYFAEWQLVNF